MYCTENGRRAETFRGESLKSESPTTATHHAPSRTFLLREHPFVLLCLEARDDDDGIVCGTVVMVKGNNKSRPVPRFALFVAGAVIVIVAQTLIILKLSGRYSEAFSASQAVDLKEGWHTIQVFYGERSLVIPNITSDRMWFSQTRQDRIVASLLRNKREGYFIDLAANDAVKLSNTLALERKFDWKGMNS